MATAILTVGLPGSGKSHWADQLQVGGWLQVNLDSCRAAVCGDASNQAATAEAVKLHEQLIDQAIAANADVIVSDTNLHPKFRDDLHYKLQFMGHDVIVAVVDTPFIVCQARNLARDRQVSFHAMTRMWDSMMSQGLC